MSHSNRQDTEPEEVECKQWAKEAFSLRLDHCYINNNHFRVDTHTDM